MAQRLSEGSSNGIFAFPSKNSVQFNLAVPNSYNKSNETFINPFDDDQYRFLNTVSGSPDTHPAPILD